MTRYRVICFKTFIFYEEDTYLVIIVEGILPKPQSICTPYVEEVTYTFEACCKNFYSFLNNFFPWKTDPWEPPSHFHLFQGWFGLSIFCVSYAHVCTYVCECISFVASASFMYVISLFICMSVFGCIPYLWMCLFGVHKWFTCVMYLSLCGECFNYVHEWIVYVLVPSSMFLSAWFLVSCLCMSVYFLFFVEKNVISLLEIRLKLHLKVCKAYLVKLFFFTLC